MQFQTRKSLFALALAACLSFGASAQSLDEGIKMVKYERYSSAEKILQPLAAADPVANYYLGIAQLEQGNKAAAQATFSKFPDDAANMAGMARLAYINGNAAEGKRIADAVVAKAKKKDWQPLVWAADAANYGGGNPQDAIGIYEEAVKRGGGDNVYLRIGLGDAYQKLQSGGGKAMDNYDIAVAKDAKNSLGYSRKGALWYAARNYNDALADYAKAKDADPSNPLPYNDLANAYFYVGKYDLAKQNIEEYLKLSDQSCEDKLRYANILFLGKDYTNTVSKMQEVINTCGAGAYRYRVLGKSQYETKDYDNALMNMRNFFANPAPATAMPDDYLYMGKIFSAKKLADSAEFYYAKALASDTSSNKKKVYGDIAESYKSMATPEGYAKAGQYYKMAVDAAGANVAAIDYFNYGVYSYYGKSYSDAASAFEQMEGKFPDQPSASYWRARVAAAVDSEGKTGAAAPLYNKWLAIPETEAYKRKPADLNYAYQYLAINAYNKDDKAAMKENIEHIKAIDPNNALAKQLEGLMNKPAAPAKSSGGAKPATGTKPKK